MGYRDVILTIIFGIFCLMAGIIVGIDARSTTFLENCQKAGVAKIGDKYYSCTMVEK